MSNLLSLEKHKARHVELHKALDELVADMIRYSTRLPSKTTVLELMEWAHAETQNPSGPSEQ